MPRGRKYLAQPESPASFQHFRQAVKNIFTLKIHVCCDVTLRHGRVFRGLSKDHSAFFIFEVKQYKNHSSCTSRPSRRRHYDPSKRRGKPLTHWHSVTSQKTWIFSNTAVKNSNLAFLSSSVSPAQTLACLYVLAPSPQSVHENSRRHTLFKTINLQNPKKGDNPSQKSSTVVGGGG